MSGDLIIDLDRDWHLLEEPAPRRPMLMRRARLIGLVLVTLFCLATFGGAQQTPEPPIVQLALMTHPTDPYAGLRETYLAGGLMLMRVSQETTAYEPDGRVRWRANPGESLSENSHHDYRMQDDLLLVRLTALHIDEEHSVETPRFTTIALDPATGKEVWRVGGTVHRVGRFTLVDGTPGTSTQVFGAMPSELLWKVPDSRASTVDAQTGSLLAVTDAGIVTEYDLATGAVRRSGKVEIPHAAPPGQPAYTHDLQITVAQDRIILQSHYAGQDFVTRSRSYDRLTLQPASSPVEHFGHLHECGPVVCADDNGRTSILDSSSYARLWQAPEGSSPYWVGAGLLLEDFQNETNVSLVDPYTGAQRVDLSGWQLVPSMSRPATASLMTRNVLPGGTFVGLLRPTGLQILGVLPHQLSSCVVDSDLMMCTADGGRIGIWQLKTLPHLTSQ